MRSLTCSILSVLLAACSGGGSETGGDVIGAAGGTVSGLDGDGRIEIPAGALTEERVFRIERVTDVPTGNRGDAVDIGPSGTRFAVPATVHFAYDETMLAGFPASGLRLATVENGEWIILDGAAVDETTRVVSGTTTHLSRFGWCSTRGGTVVRCELPDEPDAGVEDAGVDVDGGPMSSMDSGPAPDAGGCASCDGVTCSGSGASCLNATTVIVFSDSCDCGECISAGFQIGCTPGADPEPHPLCNNGVCQE